jgi:DNA/RNA endonuclease YhcR with UshA esterase domain
MKYPAFNEYQAALQHPSRCLTPPGLQKCIAEADLWGLPRVRSGGFALTYKLSDGRSTWALRCFHKHVPDREERYVSINQYIQKAGVEYLEAIQYVPEGIIIKGASFPITYMKWVEGETLETYVIRHLDQPSVLGELALKFYRLIMDLEKRKITHGDLSHHNIMVRNEKLVLVDYDGMNVPEMRQQQSCEIGNPHFQHPGRDESIFDQTTDRFSSIVIYMALKALSIDSKFWFTYETGGEGLLFRRQDFKQPFQSPLLQEMETISALNRDVRQFRQICVKDVHQVPRLEEFVNGLGIDLLTVTNDAVRVEAESPIVLDAQRKYLLTSRLGEIVTVVGKIEEVFNGMTRDNVPHLFLNFGNWKLKCFTIVLWDEALNLMETTGINPHEYQEKWVSVTGMLTAYRRRPQMIVNTPFDIEILDEERVAKKITASTPFWFVRKPVVTPERVVVKKNPLVEQKAVHRVEVEVQAIQAALDGMLKQENIDAQVANPLDISDEVVGKINDLYRSQEGETVSTSRNKKSKK